MEFKKLQKGVLDNAKKYSKRYKVKIDKEFAVLKLYEEVGEFSQALLIHNKKSRPEKHLPAKKSKKELAKELADVAGMVMVIADLFGIDLEEAIEKKWITKEWIK